MKKLKTTKSLMIVILVLHIIFFSPNQSTSQAMDQSIYPSSGNNEIPSTPFKTMDMEEIISVPSIDSVGTILLLHADNPDNANFIISFLSTHGINAEQYAWQLMTYTPILADLMPYQIVIVWTNFLPQDPITTGNVLADYVDAGGSVIMTTYSHSPVPSGIEGRFISEQYSAFIKTGAPNSGGRVYDGLSTHPIFDEVSTIQSGSPSEQIVLDPGATLVASYTDTVPLSAIKGKVVNINVWFGPSVIGDYALLLANAINYLDRDVLLLFADTDPTPTIISELIAPYGHTVDQMNVSTGIPTLSQIKWYPVIISWTNSTPAIDNIAWGDLIADYIDGGGTFIMLPFTYFQDPWSLAGRFLDEKYSPITYSPARYLTASYTGGSTHSIFAGVNDYTTSVAMLPTLRFAARAIALYEDKTIFAAMKGSVLAINSYIPSNTGGDIGLLLSNAIEYFLNGLHLDVDAPTVTSPVDVMMEYGSTGNTLEWTLNDVNPYTYDLKLDGVSIEGGIWSNGLVVWTGLDGFGLGNYTFEITAFDLAGNFTTDIAIASVVDDLPPTVIGPEDIDMIVNDLTNITWIPIDLLPADYKITQNGTEIETGSWVSGENIVVYLENLIIGVFIFEIAVSDSSSNVVTDSVLVTVLSSGIPIISGPLDIYFIEGDSGRKITWYFSDNDPTIYVLERDSAVLDTASYVGLPFIEIQLSNYTNGNYNFTLTLYDETGNFASDTVLVHILIRNPAGAGSGSPSPSGGPGAFFDNPTVIAVTAGIVILGAGMLILRRRA